MKELVKGNLKVIEIKEGKIYEGKKATKNGVYRIQRRFNDVNLEKAMEYMEKVN